MLITEEYKAQIEQMHSNDKWGTTGANKADRLTAMALGLGAKTILDYGCGEGTFKTASDALMRGLEVINYDPAMPEFSAEPAPADFVVCIDVLEHVEPDCIDHVLWHLESLMKMGGYLCPCLVPAGRNLPDGRNAHLIVEPAEWWIAKIGEHFDITVDLLTKFHVGMIVYPKGLQKRIF